MIDWTLPLKQVPRPDVDGGSYGPTCYLRAMLTDDGEFVSLSASRVDRDTQRHFKQQFDQGIRFMVTADREIGKPIYYRADGTPWLPHHSALMNTAGKAVPLEDRAEAAIVELQLIEERRAAERKESIERGKRAAQAAVDRKHAAERDQDAMESNALWGAF